MYKEVLLLRSRLARATLALHVLCPDGKVPLVGHDYGCKAATFMNRHLCDCSANSKREAWKELASAILNN